jgi:hypothetical protein
MKRAGGAMTNVQALMTKECTKFQFPTGFEQVQNLGVWGEIEKIVEQTS